MVFRLMIQVIVNGIGAGWIKETNYSSYMECIGYDLKQEELEKELVKTNWCSCDILNKKKQKQCREMDSGYTVVYKKE